MGKKFGAVIFDKDGVLIDSLDTCLMAFNQMRRHYGLNPKNKGEFIKRYWGKKAGNNVKKSGDVDDEQVRERVEYYRKRRDELEHMTNLYPNTLPVLEKLKEKYKLGVVTNTERKVALKLLDDFKILDYFDVVVGGDETDPKPSPKPLIMACDKMKVKPERTLYVGDTLTDVEAGKASGCTVAIITTSRTSDELEKFGVIVINDIRQVLETI